MSVQVFDLGGIVIRPQRRSLAGCLDWLRAGYARSRQRAALARLDARLLADIGISPAQARQEANKPFWVE